MTLVNRQRVPSPGAAAQDLPGVAVSPTALTVPEGESRTCTVVLKTRPTAPVTVRPTIAGDADLSVTPAARTFTPANWSSAQAFTVSVAEDVDVADGTATITPAAGSADDGRVFLQPSLHASSE